VSQSSVVSRVGRGLTVVVAVFALVAQAGAAYGAAWVWQNEPLLKDQLVAHQFEASNEILRYASAAGLSQTGELYFLASLPQIVPSVEFDRYCTRNEPGIGVLGCYTIRDRRIYLFDVTDERLTSVEPVVAAHEMLHAAWARLSVEERNRLAELLEEGFASLPQDHRLRERIASYEADNPASRIPELYAILGTEIRDLPQALEDHYSLYFSDRDRVVSLSDEVYRVFSEVSDELQALATDLESRAAEIEGLRYTWEQTSASLRGDISAFNADMEAFRVRAESGGFRTQSEYDQARNALEQRRPGLEQRQTKVRDLRTTLQAKIDEYNTLLEELTVLNAEVSELNQGINVTLREADELEPENPELEE
jgi:hypothetical protein